MSPAAGRAARRSVVVETRGLTKTFGGLHAVDSVSLDIPAGSIFGLVGPNGAGKTTYLNVINGLIPSSSGTTRVLGTETTGWPPQRVARLGVARTFQTIKLVADLTVAETVVSGRYRLRHESVLGSVLATPAERRSRRQSLEIAHALLERVGLDVPPERLATSLSYGEQRRLEIARALASEPQLLLLDEPTAGMNSQESEQLGELMIQLQESGLTLLMVEHNMALVRKYCTDAVVLSSGSLLVSGDPAECLDDPRVQEAYFGVR